MANILVVDDNEEITDLVQYFLEEARHTVTSVNTSQDACTALENEAYDILITDLLMPEENGFDLIRKAKEIDNNTKPLKIIAISGGLIGIGTKTVLDAASLSADTVIKKPFTQTMIQEAVDNLLKAA